MNLGELDDNETDIILQKMFDSKPDKEKLLMQMASLSDEDFKELIKEVRQIRKTHKKKKN